VITGPKRQRTSESIKKKLIEIDAHLATADPLTRLHLIQEQQDLEAELSSKDNVVDVAALEKAFIKVAKHYGERKGISYSAWRSVGIGAPVLQQAKIARTRG
jgi:high-affinity K+ transport system ATPase subunit B